MSEVRLSIVDIYFSFVSDLKSFKHAHCQQCSGSEFIECLIMYTI